MTLAERLVAAEQDRLHAPAPSGVQPGQASAEQPQHRGAARDPFAQLKRLVHTQLVDSLGPKLYDVNLTAVELEREVRAALQQAIAATDRPMSGADRTRITQEIADDILGYG